MDTRMIEVAIGLALVFALTSLLAAAAQEAWSSLFKLRGEILRKAVVSFVGDDANLAKALLEHPLLVSLTPKTQKDSSARPSYVDGASLISALLDHLSRTHTATGARPATPSELVEVVAAVASGRLPPAAPIAAGLHAGLAGAPAARPTELFARGLQSLLAGAEHDWPTYEKRLVAWFDSVGDRSTGWFKRRTQLGVFIIGLLTAAAANVNPIVIAPRLWNDGAVRLAMVEAATKLDASTGKATTVGASTPSAPPSTAPRAASNPGAAASAAPASLGLAMDGNVASGTPLADALEALRNALDAAAQTPPPAGSAQRAALLNLIERTASARTALAQWQQAGAVPDAAATAALAAPLAFDGSAELALALPTWPAVQASLAQARAAVAALALAPAEAARSEQPATAQTTVRKESMACEGGENLSPEFVAMCDRLDALGQLKQAGLPIGWSPIAKPAVAPNGLPWLDTVLMPVGWLITALACTLGAPFWFDALGKLVKLRGSGSRPEGTPVSGDQTKGGSGGGGSRPTGAGGVLAVPPGPSDGSGGGDAQAMSDALTDEERLLTMPEKQRIQRALGMMEPDVSGWFDGKTRDAIKAWQTQRSLLPATGALTAFQIAELLALRGLAPTTGEGDGAVG